MPPSRHTCCPDPFYGRLNLPGDYGKVLRQIKRRIGQERLRVVLAANPAMVLLYWDIGRTILERQERAGWGAWVIDRLAQDLRDAFPDMKGFSPRNLKYMRAFAAAWPKRAIVQQLAAQIPWFHVAQWETRIVEKLPKALKGSLPTVEQLEAELAKDERAESK